VRVENTDSEGVRENFSGELISKTRDPFNGHPVKEKLLLDKQPNEKLGGTKSP
jgi:hypothetical protein